MDKNKTKSVENDIVFSQTIHAGSRIYYVDVKKTRAEEMYLSVTESKKVMRKEKVDGEWIIEKHKIFLYREDFAQFMSVMQKAMDYVATQQGEAVPRNLDKMPEEDASAGLGDKIKINIEF